MGISVTRTVLLTDIEGSTAHWERDPAAMEEAVRRHDELIHRLVAARGGEVVKHKGEGDSSFSVFERASDGVDAAVALQLAFGSEPWPTADPIRVRAALHTGEVEQRDGDYFGRTVNRAARIRTLAGGGTILVSRPTAALVADVLPEGASLLDLGEHELRDVARPERLHAVRHVDLADPASILAHLRAGTAPSVPAALRGHGDSPLVGRDRELAGLDEIWSTAAAGRPSLAFVSGEPGVGKSRLVAALAEQVASGGAQVLFGRSDEEPLRPYQPIAEALASALGRLPLSDLADALGDRLGDLALLVPELRARAHAAGADAAPGDRFALLEAAAGCFRFLAGRRPLLLVLDDLHWADEATLQLLRHVLRSAGDTPMLVVATYRDTELRRSRPLADSLGELRRDVPSIHVDLPGLARDDVAALLGDRLADRFDEVWRATDGNPFFVVEVRGALLAGARSEVPHSIRQSVGARVGRLADTEVRLLEAAAVVGVEADVAIAAVAAGVAEEEVTGCVQAGLLTHVPGIPGRVRFAHALARDAVLGDLPGMRRVALHRRVAAAIEERHAGALDQHAARIAHHYTEAGELGAGGPAYRWTMRAGRVACDLLAFDDAERLFRAAGELAGTAGDGAAEALAHIEMADTLCFRGDFDRQNDVLDRVITYATATGDVELHGRALISVGYFKLAPDEDYLAALERVWPTLPQESPLREVLRARAALETAGLRPGPEGPEALRAMLASARVRGQPDALLSALFWNHMALGPEEVSLDEIVAMVRSERQRGRDSATPAAGPGLGVGEWLYEPELVLVQCASVRPSELLWHGDVPGARRALADFEHRYGATAGALSFGLPVLAADDAMLRGDHAEAQRRAGELVPVENVLADLAWARWAAQQYDAGLVHGRLAPLVPLLEASSASVRTVPERLALAYAEVGRRDDATAALDRLTGYEEAVSRFGRGPGAMYCALLLARAAAATGHDQAAAVLYEVLQPHAGRIISPWGFSVDGATDHHLGLLATTIGRDDDAVSHLEDALRIHERAGWRVLVADTKASLGGALARRRSPGDVERATGLLRDAERLAVELDLPPVRRRVEEARRAMLPS